MDGQLSVISYPLSVRRNRLTDNRTERKDRQAGLGQNPGERWGIYVRKKGLATEPRQVDRRALRGPFVGRAPTGGGSMGERASVVCYVAGRRKSPGIFPGLPWPLTARIPAITSIHQ